jgi:cupin 2 domain-containing protein
MKQQNIYANIPAKAEAEFFQTLLQNKNVTIERIVSHGHTSPTEGYYDQERDEWVILLEGEAILSFETKEDVHLTKGDYYFIKAHEKHRVSWTKEDCQSLWLAIFI